MSAYYLWARFTDPRANGSDRGTLLVSSRGEATSQLEKWRNNQHTLAIRRVPDRMPRVLLLLLRRFHGRSRRCRCVDYFAHHILSQLTKVVRP